MRRQRRRVLGLALTATVLISISGFCATRPAQAKDPFSDPKNTEKLVDAYITAMTMAYPPAGGALKVAKSLMGTLGFFNSGDPVGESIKAINTRLDEVQARIDTLESELRNTRNTVFINANLENIRELRRHREKLEDVALELARKPADQFTKDKLVRDARRVADTIRDEKQLWQWSDLALKDHRWGGKDVKAGTMLDPDFKPMPTFEVYTAALVIWMAAIEHAGGGDTQAVSGTYGNALQRHIDFLSVRPGWKETMDDPQTLPEEIRSRINGELTPSNKYPDKDGVCYISERLEDHMARQSASIADGGLQYRAATPNELCTVPARRRNRATASERELEREYGSDVMASLASLLTSVRDKGTARGVVVASPPDTPATPSTPSQPSAPVEPFTGRHKAVHEDGGFSTGGGKVEQNILYGVQQDGGLIWHRHWIDFRPGQARHKFAPTTRVGDGWKVGYQGAYPGGDTWIYTLSDAGELRLFRHLGAMDGSYRWREPSLVVATDWGNFKQIIPMDHGVVYQLMRNGTLRWTKYWDYERGKASGVQAWFAPRNAPGFWPYLTVFSGGNGVLYGVHIDGRLMWHKHVNYKDGGETWLGPKQVGEGWNGFTKIFSPGEGHIYGILPNGDLMYYRHLGWANGSYTWDENIKGKIAEGWNGYASAFARIITGDPEEIDQPN